MSEQKTSKTTIAVLALLFATFFLAGIYVGRESIRERTLDEILNEGDSGSDEATPDGEERIG